MRLTKGVVLSVLALVVAGGGAGLALGLATVPSSKLPRAAETLGPLVGRSGYPGEGTAQADRAARIDRLIGQLGSEQFAERESASRDLARYGDQALPALRQAARSGDAEVRRRAKDLLQRIKEKAENPVRGRGGKPLPLYWDGR